MFLLRLSGRSVKTKNILKAYKTKHEERQHQCDCCFEFDKTTKSRFVRISYDRLSKLKRLPVAHVTIYEKDKNIYFGNFCFQWLEIEQIRKILIEISKFVSSIEKVI